MGVACADAGASFGPFAMDVGHAAAELKTGVLFGENVRMPGVKVAWFAIYSLWQSTGAKQVVSSVHCKGCDSLMIVDSGS